MKITRLPHELKATDVPLEQLAGNSRLSEQEKIAGLTRQFEAVLLRQILQSARKTVVHSKLNPESSTKSIYDDLITSQFADKISKSGALGLGETLRQQLTRQLGGKELAAAEATKDKLP